LIEYQELADGGWLQALLDEWRAELARKPLGMTQTEACALLEVDVRDDEVVDEESLKIAYRSAATCLHVFQTSNLHCCVQTVPSVLRLAKEGWQEDCVLLLCDR